MEVCTGGPECSGGIVVVSSRDRSEDTPPVHRRDYDLPPSQQPFENHVQHVKVQTALPPQLVERETIDLIPGVT
jgi:hypothetical protein